MNSLTLNLPLESYSTEIRQLADRMVLELHETYPMYAPPYFAEVEKLYAEILNAKPVENEVDAQLLLAKLG